jgi:hypothetical protein
MTKDPRVLNVATGFRLKLNQARKAVDNCACAWVEYGVSVRPLSINEQRAALAGQAKHREPLPYAEIFGLRFDAPAGMAGASRQSRVLAYEATLLVEDMISAGRPGIPAVGISAQ